MLVAVGRSPGQPRLRGHVDGAAGRRSRTVLQYVLAFSATGDELAMREEAR